MNYEKLESNIIRELQDLHIRCEKIDFEDDDLNYYLDVDLKYFSDELKNIGNVRVFMYIDTVRETINLLCSNMYRESRKDSLIKVMNVTNAVNGLIRYGKVFVDNKGRVVYQHAIAVCGEKMDIERYIKALVLAILMFYQEMKKIEGNNEKR